MPINNYVTQYETDENIWKYFKNGDEKNWVMAASCMVEKYGLYSRHTYTVLGVLDLQQNGKSHQKLLKMRNPHGSERYNGPWRDNDP